jgi:Tfp pilus assembly protein PilN
MKNIDFLPESYRRRRLQRRAQTWEATILLLFGVVVAATAILQAMQRWRVTRELAATEVVHRSAEEVQKSHEALQAKLSQAAQVAELYNYLEHPWPRTQVLRTLSDCLPESAAITRVEIVREQVQAFPPPASETKEETLTPPQLDVKQLRQEYDQRPNVVTLSGLADNARQVHAFVDRLSTSPLLASVRLESVENQEGPTQRTAFRLRGVLKSAYGQPGGAARPLSPRSQTAGYSGPAVRN